MKLLDSLLDAIVRLEGDALVMHVGEKPYVVTASSSMNAYRGPLAWGQVELSSRVLTFDAVSSMLGQLLPADQQQALTEFGAIEHDIASPAGVADRFTVIAARGGEDVWVELRRRPIDPPQAQELEALPSAVAPVDVQTASHASTPAEPVEVASPVVAAPVAAAYIEPVAEPAADAALHGIELTADPQALDDAQPAANIRLDAPESIVVAIPGHEAEEFTLNGAPDDEIQVIDDEPQGVPTEEEVDAMLAGTATVLLTSGLAGEVVSDDDGQGAVVVDGPADAVSSDDETEIVLTGVVAAVPIMVIESIAQFEPVAVESAWELSPPPAVAAGVESHDEGESVAEAPFGAPLFSEQAVLAAVPSPAEVLADEATVVEPSPVVEFMPSNYAPVLEAPPVNVVAELPPSILDSYSPQTQPPFAAPAESTPIALTPVDAVRADLDPVIEHARQDESPVTVEDPRVLYAPSDFAPASELTLVVPAPSDSAPLSEVAPIVEPAPMLDAAVAVGPETDVVTPPAPSVELPAAAHLGSESVGEELQPAAAIVVGPTTPSAPFETVSAQPDATPLEPAIQPHEFVVTSSVAPTELEDARGTENFSEVWVPSELERLTPSEATVEMRSAGDDMPADAAVSTINAGAGPAVSLPTPQSWTPSAPEMTMEVRPELHGQEEPVAHAAGVHWSTVTPDTPKTEAPEPVSQAEAPAHAEEETRHAVVVPLVRTPIKPESVSVPFTPSEDAALMHTLRVAAARGASTVYVVAQSKPMIRIDGEIGPLESEPTLTAADVDRLVMELAPPRRRDALQNGPVEWLCDVPEIGRVRCLTFRDHRGPGVLFRMFPPRAISADQLGLTPEVQALCQQSDGLVLVTGARASGKSTLLNAFVDLINRTRSDYLITIESQIGFVHESRRSFVSQRESRGDADLAATYARAALREDPDVMMVEDLKSPELVSAALEAAESGRLVLASVPAASTIGALERLIEVFPADRRAKARASLATALRGVIAQVLLRRVKGGRVAAREILLNTPAVSQVVLEGKMFQLPVALDSGRRHGMVPLTDSLAAHVRDGTVHVAEAYRKALDRAALVALLKREGIDTSFAERLA